MKTKKRLASEVLNFRRRPIFFDARRLDSARLSVALGGLYNVIESSKSQPANLRAEGEFMGATLLEPTRQIAEVVDNESRIVIPCVSWDDFLAIAKVLDASPGTKVAYDRGFLEIMTTSHRHEFFKTFLSYFIEDVLVELNLASRPTGSALWKTKATARGVEPDAAYYLESAAKINLDVLESDEAPPPPDLVVEIDISPSKLDRPAIYAALKGPEVWRFDGVELHIDRLAKDGTYRVSAESRALPGVTAADVGRWLATADLSLHVDWRRRLRSWIRKTMKPRSNPSSRKGKRPGRPS
ncbi:MAG: hypothetical protein NVSMB14_01180 [Isosphaeraceae bacterium]